MDRKEETMRVVPVTKEEVKLLAANNLSKKKLKKLFLYLLKLLQWQ